MKFIGILLCLVASQICFAQKNYTITGKITKATDITKIFAQHSLGDDYTKDSAMVKNGSFTLSGKLDETTIVYLTVKRKNNKRTKTDALTVFIDAGNYTLNINDSLKYANLQGSASQNDYLAMEAAAKPANDKMLTLYNEYDVAYQNKDEATMKALDKKIEDLDKNVLQPAYENFLKTHWNSSVALLALEKIAGFDLDYDKANPLWLQLPDAIKNTKKGKEFANSLDIAKKTKVGVPAIAFTQNNVDGKAINLTDFKGKYVLIDFWASWCGPCREENPNVLKNYTKFKDKNFTVLGVSLDRQKDKWIKAIKDDKLDWTQVSDLKFWNNEVAQLYGIKSIPQNFLVDPNGIIVAKNLREEELDKKLTELLK
jgi:peroxiredoxin